MSVRRPTKDDIISLRNELVATCDLRDKRMKDAERMFDVDAWDTKKLDMEDRLASPIGHNTVNMLTSMTVAAKMQISVPPDDPTNKSERAKCERLEDFLRALRSYHQRKLIRRLEWDMAFWAYLRGSFFPFVCYDPDLPEGLRMEVRDPLTIYPEIDRGRLVRVVTYDERTLSSVRRELHMPDLLTGKRGTDTIAFTEYWDDAYKAYAVEEEVLYITEHKQFGLPFSMCTGWGTPLTAPEKSAYGILYAMKDLWKSLNKVSSYIATASKNAIIGGTIVNGEIRPPSGMSLDDVAQHFTDPGVVFFAENSDSPVTTQPIMNGRLPPETSQMLQVTQRWLDESGIPSIVYGVEPSGVTAALGIQALLSGPKAKIQPFIVSVETGMSWMLEHAALICKEHLLLGKDKPLSKLAYVNTVPTSGGYQRVKRIASLNKNDIDESLMVEVRIGDIMPKDNVQIATVANILAQGKLLSKRDIRQEFLSRDNPDEDADNITEEEILELPQSKMMLAALVAAQRGLPLEPFLADMGLIPTLQDRMKMQQEQNPMQSRGVNPGEIGPGGNMVPPDYMNAPQGPVPNQALPARPMGAMLPPAVPGRPTTAVEAADYLQSLPRGQYR